MGNEESVFLMISFYISFPALVTNGSFALSDKLRKERTQTFVKNATVQRYKNGSKLVSKWDRVACADSIKFTNDYAKIQQLFHAKNCQRFMLKFNNSDFEQC